MYNEKCEAVDNKSLKKMFVFFYSENKHIDNSSTSLRSPDVTTYLLQHHCHKMRASLEINKVDFSPQ